MLFRQLFERESSACTYLIAPRGGGEALLIDPVKTELSKSASCCSSPSKQMDIAVPANLACGAA